MDLKDAKKLEYAREDEAQTFAEDEVDEEAVECNNGVTVAQWVARSPHIKKVASSRLGWVSWHFCVEFACSPHVGVGFLRVLRFPRQVQRHAVQVNKWDDDDAPYPTLQMVESPLQNVGEQELKGIITSFAVYCVFNLAYPRYIKNAKDEHQQLPKMEQQFKFEHQQRCEDGNPKLQEKSSVQLSKRTGIAGSASNSNAWIFAFTLVHAFRVCISVLRLAAIDISITLPKSTEKHKMTQC